LQNSGILGFVPGDRQAFINQASSNTTDINQFIGVDVARLREQQFNTEQNRLASEAEIEAARLATEKQVGKPKEVNPNLLGVAGELTPEDVGLTFEDMEKAGGEGVVIVGEDGTEYVITPFGTLRPLAEAVSSGAVPEGGAPAEIPVEGAPPNVSSGTRFPTQYIAPGGGSLSPIPQTTQQQEVQQTQVEPPTEEVAPTTPTPTVPAPPPRDTSEDVILNEILADPDASDAFDSLPKELQLLLTELSNRLNLAIEAGNVVNPDIEITPEQAAEFLGQAETELDPFFKTRP